MGFDCDALIIGGGPSGLITGSLISEKGFKTIILEEHSEIGKPEQCTGLVSWRIGAIPEKLVLNKIRTARFCFGEKCFEVSSSKKMLVIDRAGYDKYLADKALEKMVEIRRGERAIGFKENKVVTNRKNFYSSRILVGADGPNSIIAKLTGLKQPRSILFAIQYVAKGVFEQDVVELRFEPEFSKNAFAWVVPLSNSIAKVGLATEDNPVPRIRLFLKKFKLEAVGKPMGDSIRFGVISKAVAPRLILVGDAACQVKPFSFGGLVYGKICSEIAGEACVKALEENIMEEKFLNEVYDLKWRKAIGGALRKGFYMRKLFSIVRKIPACFTLIKNLGLDLLAEKFLDPDFLKQEQYC